MPVEIRELLIRANIQENSTVQQQPAQTKDEDCNCPVEPDTKTIVRECAELVMEMLQQRSGR